jgi:hypothetical protein
VADLFARWRGSAKTVEGLARQRPASEREGIQNKTLPGKAKNVVFGRWWGCRRSFPTTSVGVRNRYVGRAEAGDVTES